MFSDKNLSTEGAVIASSLIDKDALQLACDVLNPHDFYTTRHQEIWKAIKGLHETHKAVDSHLVLEELRRTGNEAISGGSEYLDSIVLLLPTSAHIEAYVRKVKDESRKRDMIKVANEILQSCENGELEVDEIVETAEKGIYNCSIDNFGGELVYAKELVPQALDEVEAMFLNKRPKHGVTSGIGNLDHLIQGFLPGQMIVLAARPGMGKTSLALNMVEDIILKQKKTVIFYSLEMDNTELLKRLFSSLSKISCFSVDNGMINSDSYKSVTEAAEKISESPLVLSTNSSLNVTSLKASARRFAGRLNRDKEELGLIVVDYLQLLTGSRGKRFENQTAEVTDISRQLKSLAIELKVPILTLSQLSRATEDHGSDGRPQLHHLRQSGAIEQDADLVIMIYRPNTYKKGMTDEERGKTELIVAKHRNGPTGKADAYFNGKLMRFENVEKEII